MVGTSIVADGLILGSLKVIRPVMDGTVKVIEGTVRRRSGNEKEGKEGRPKVDRDGHKLVGIFRRLPE